MCLIIEVQLPKYPREKAGVLTRAAGSARLLELAAQRQPRHSAGSRFFVGHPGDGCACVLLAENADLENPYYQLDSEGAGRLAHTIEFLLQQPGGQPLLLEAAYVSGAWSDRISASRKRVTSKQLVSEIRSGRIGANILYEVGSEAG